MIHPACQRLRRRNDRVLIYGHRGARGVFPENTMPGFDYLVAIGIDAVEFDVLSSADGVPVLTHNPALAPETTRDPSGRWLEATGPKIVETAAAELALFDVGAIRVGSEYQARFGEQARLDRAAIPTLDAFCRWAAMHPAMLLDIEIKSFADRPDLSPEPGVLVAQVMEAVQRHRLDDRCIVQSFDWRVLRALAAHSPDIPRGYLSRVLWPGETHDGNVSSGSFALTGVAVAPDGADLPEVIAADGGHFWCPYFEDLTPDLLARAQALGLLVNVWTVNEVADLARLAAMGVDGIITDYPARAQNVLAALGLGWRLD